MAVPKSKSNWKLSEFVAHGANVNCLCLSPNNGHMLATGGDDRKVNLWLVGKPNNIMSISGMTSPVQSVVFNNTENWLGAGSKSGVIKVFDLEQNRAVRSISGHKAAICSLDFHRYGDILGSGSMDTNLKLWDVRRKGCIFTYKGHSEVIRDIQFSPDGKWIATASSDCTVKIWDLSAGKMIVDFKTHTKGVNTVQFHPKEFLMASGSADRTVRFYDLERFQMVGETPVESTGVRKVLFHPEGSALFTSTEEALKIHGWEPVKNYDMLPLHWGKIEDMTVSGEQLIAASCAQTNVSLWCIDIKQLRPFSGDTTTLPTEPVSSADPPVQAGVRKMFEYEQQEVPPSSPPPPQAAAGGVAVNGSSNGEAQTTSIVSADEEGSPPSQIKDKDRMELFAARQKLIRTPPKKIPSVFAPPHETADPPTPSLPPQSKLNQVQYVPNFSHPESGGRQQDIQPVGVQRRLHRADDPIGARARSAQDSHVAVSSSNHKAAGEQAGPAVKDFLPPVSSNRDVGVPSSRSRVGEIITNHVDVCQILKSRLTGLREIRAEWTASDPRASLELAVNSNNVSVLVDVLAVLHLKRTLWTLDMALIVLPELKLLLHSKYTSYVECGCNIIKLILKSFGPVIKSNLASPPKDGRDLQRDQRYEKCQICSAHLLALREEASRIVREASTSPSGKVIRERALMAAFVTFN